MASIATLLSRTRRIRLTIETTSAGSRPPKIKSAPTLFGWTPGLRSLVAGRVLGCGCLIGLYETQIGDLIEIIDAVGPACPHSSHVLNRVGEALDPISQPGVQ